MLLAIKDSLAEEEHRPIFGAWIAEGLKLNKGKGHSGGGESYVHSSRPYAPSLIHLASFLWKYVDGVLKVFKATGKNDYIALCEPMYLSFGGGSVCFTLFAFIVDELIVGTVTMASIWTTPCLKVRLHLVQRSTTNRCALATPRGT